MSDDASTRRPRYSKTPLPPYSYVPGFTPHPVSDPRGHMHGHVAKPPAALEPEYWQESEAYRYGIDLFNHGYYWEAHEAWESLWHAAGRRGPVATWLKALIKLAAAAVKLREGNAAGARRHAWRSLELQNELRAALSPQVTDYCGIALSEAEETAKAIAAEAESGALSTDPMRLLNHWLRLHI